MKHGRRAVGGLAGVAASLIAFALPMAGAAAAPSPGRTSHAAATPIKHFLFLMQGGRTFDNYFGTYPGADGPPTGTCQPLASDHAGGKCVKPFLLNDADWAPLGANGTIVASQWDGGKMDGFVSAFRRQGRDGATAMGYYNAAKLPFYWQAAQNYVLFDRFFSDTKYGIRDNRSYWVSASPAPDGPGGMPKDGYGNLQTIFDRLQAVGVRWKFYVEGYNPRQTYQTVSSTSSETQSVRVPLVDYRRFIRDPALASHIVDLTQYYKDLRSGQLPDVAYVASSSGADERSAKSILAGQSLVAAMTTELMKSPYWDSSALMWSYDGSGGWFDGVHPPVIAGHALGFRVPALLVSAYARKGVVDHTVLDYASALRFIEQNWGLAPLTKLDARANSLSGAFDFASAPRSPVLLRADIPSGLDAYPTAKSLTQGQVGLAYLLYLGAAAVTVALLVIAAGATRAASRRRARAGRAADGGTP